MNITKVTPQSSCINCDTIHVMSGEYHIVALECIRYNVRWHADLSPDIDTRAIAPPDAMVCDDYKEQE